MSETLKYIGSKIRELRQERELTIEGLAIMGNVAKSYLGRLERGEVNCSVDTLVDISNALDVHITSLFPSPEQNNELIKKINSQKDKELISEVLEYCLNPKSKRDLELIVGLIRSMK